MIGLGHRFSPPIDCRRGLYEGRKNVTLALYLFIFDVKANRGKDLIGFTIISRSSVRSSPGQGQEGVHFRREWAIICPGENRPIPSKLTVGIPGFTFILSKYLTRIVRDKYCFHTVIYNVCHCY